MARTLLSFVPHLRPAKARITVDGSARIVQHYRALRILAPDLAVHLEHVAADLHARAALSARPSLSRHAHYVLLLWAICYSPLLIGV